MQPPDNLTIMSIEAMSALPPAEPVPFDGEKSAPLIDEPTKGTQEPAEAQKDAVKEVFPDDGKLHLIEKQKSKTPLRVSRSVSYTSLIFGFCLFGVTAHYVYRHFRSGQRAPYVSL